jgi:hypothetical protein
MSTMILCCVDWVNVIGGSYNGRSAIIVKVTKHMYQIRLLHSVGNKDEVVVVRVMKWNVEIVRDEVSDPSLSLVSELAAMRDVRHYAANVYYFTCKKMWIHAVLVWVI